MGIRVDRAGSFHVLMGQSVVEMSLEALHDAHHGQVIGPSTLVWQEGWQDWVRLEAALARVSFADQRSGPLSEPSRSSTTADETSGDMYFVQVGPEQVRQLTFDELDQAYREDRIDDATLIWQPGYPEWIPLSALGSLEAIPALLTPVADLPSERIELDAPRLLPSQFPVAAPRTDPSALSPLLRISPSPDSAPADSGSAAPDSTAAVIASWPSEPWPEQSRGPSWSKRALAMAAGAVLVVSAHRQGLTYAFAQRAGQGEAYQKLVGEPDVRTVQGLELWLSRLTHTYGLAQLSATDVVAPAQRVATDPAKPAPDPALATYDSAPASAPTDAAKVAPLLDRGADSTRMAAGKTPVVNNVHQPLTKQSAGPEGAAREALQQPSPPVAPIAEMPPSATRTPPAR